MGDVNFKPEKRAAANRGSRAAVIAGLPATEMEAMRAGSAQNFQDRTRAVRGQMEQQQVGNAQQGLGNLLQLVALMRGGNGNAAGAWPANENPNAGAGFPQGSPQPRQHQGVSQEPAAEPMPHTGLSPLMLKILLEGGYL